MPEHEFSLIRIFLYMDSIYDSVLVQENTGHRKPVFLHVLCSANFFVFSLQNKLKTLFWKIVLLKYFAKVRGKQRWLCLFKNKLDLSFSLWNFYHQVFHKRSASVKTEAYSKPFQKSKMKRFAKVLNDFKLLNIFAKRSILDVW